MKLSQIKDFALSVAVNVGAGTLNIEFHPSRFTRSMQKELAALAKAAREKIEKGETPDDDATESTAQMLVKLLDSWDLEDDKGKRCPITVRFIADELGYYAANRIANAVVEALNPNAQSGGGG